MKLGFLAPTSSRVKHAEHRPPRYTERDRNLLHVHALKMGETPNARIARRAKHRSRTTRVFVATPRQRTVEAGWVKVAACIRILGVFRQRIEPGLARLSNSFSMPVAN